MVPLRYPRGVPEGHTPFAIVNRTANPIVSAFLRSPFHPLLSSSLALITVTGRRTRRRYTFPVGYRQHGDRVSITVGWPARKNWWRNLTDPAPVELRIRGTRLQGLAHARGDQQSGVTVEVQLNPTTDN